LQRPACERNLVEMAPSNNNADSLLASAHDSAAHDGLRTAAPRYLEAVDALVDDGRRQEAADVLVELLRAKEKKRALFFVRQNDNPLGKERLGVARRYATLARGEAPTETSLDVLAQIALEFPDDVEIRLSNADALRQAGYLLDALDEFKYCANQRPHDVDLVVRLCDLYAQLGRNEEAVALVHSAISEFGKKGDDAAVAQLALRMLDYAPDAYERSFEAFASLAGDSLARNKAPFDEALSAFSHAHVADPVRRGAILARISACFAKLLGRDRNNRALWQQLTGVDEGVANDVRQLLDGATARPAQASPEPVVDGRAAGTSAQPVVQTAQPNAAIQAPSPAPAAAVTPAPQTAVASAEAQTAATPPAARPAAAAGGLSAFAKRKALELFANSQYEAASVQLERLVKMSPDVEGLEMLLECYLAMDRHDQAARVGVQLADAELAAGNKPAAIAALTSLSKKIADPAIEQRRVELMQG
jgi:tetratricopeptide (TPR) repeat protein